MAKENKIIQPYLKHDINASQDGKILRLYLDFRKTAKTMTREELESFACHGAYALFWHIIEYLFSNNLYIDDVEMLADNLRVESKFLNKILNDYGLFHLKDNEYISDRLLRDLERQKEKSKKASESANIRYLLSEFNSAYVEFFGEEAVLETEEIEKLKRYSNKIPDLKSKLRDIIFTLKNLKFDTDINFVPCANWLLKDNHLVRLVNGEFGKLQHKPTAKEIKEEADRLKAERQKQNTPSETELQAEQISSRIEAVDFILEKHIGKKIVCRNGKAFVEPLYRQLMNRFDISDAEIMRGGVDE